MDNRKACWGAILGAVGGLTLGGCGTDDDWTAAPAGPGLGELDTVDWTRAGYPGAIPDISDNVIDVTTVGALCDGSTDDSLALQTAIDEAATPAVLHLPANASCLIQSPLTMASGVVLRGHGSESSELRCESQDGCVQIQGSPAGDYVAIQGGLEQGSTQVILADPSGFVVGQGAELRQEQCNVPPDADWGDQNVGQMAKITAIDGDTLTIEPPLHIQLLASRQPMARPVEWVEQVGIEYLTIRRVDAGGSSGNNLSIRRAADCWVRAIESNFTEHYHVAVSESVQVELRDSFLHDAKSKGDGGQGYGASLGRLATSILVENNVFSETRHAMIVQIGTSGCVFGYNYAEHNYSDDGWDKTYISLHGHYPFMNLFEGNIVGWIGVDDVWGPSGPGNTFFRNRVVGTDRHQDFGDSRGIQIDSYEGTQNVIGNEVFGEGIFGDLADVVVHGNNVNGEVTWDESMGEPTLPASYYLAQKPGFYGTRDWPSLGGDLPAGEGTIPALDRLTEDAPVPQP